MATKGEEVETELDDVVFCSICLSPYDEKDLMPKYLDCHHFFCLTCINKLYTPVEQTLCCPVCRHVTYRGDEVQPLASLTTSKVALCMMEVAEARVKEIKEIEERERQNKELQKENEKLNLIVNKQRREYELGIEKLRREKEELERLNNQLQKENENQKLIVNKQREDLYRKTKENELVTEELHREKEKRITTKVLQMLGFIFRVFFMKFLLEHIHPKPQSTIASDHLRPKTMIVATTEKEDNKISVPSKGPVFQRPFKMTTKKMVILLLLTFMTEMLVARPKTPEWSWSVHLIMNEILKMIFILFSLGSCRVRIN